jgi:hypothetical protein
LFSLFCKPTEVNSYVKAKNMHNNADLAGQLVIMTTLLSGFTIFGDSRCCAALGMFSSYQQRVGAVLTTDSMHGSADSTSELYQWI